MGQRDKAQYSPWDVRIVPKLFLDHLNAEKWIIKICQAKERIQQHHHNISCIVCFEAVVCGLDNVSNNQLKYAIVSGIKLSFNYNRQKWLKWNSHIPANVLRFLIQDTTATL